MSKVLIIGGSGYIGQAIYKELCGYMDTYSTYFTNRSFAKNQHFFHFDVERNGIDQIIAQVRPQIIISALRGNFEAQVDMHQYLTKYVSKHDCKLIFLSSANVFDTFVNFPSYEYDKTFSESIYGRLKIKIENMLMRLPQKKWAIARMPMVFGAQSPRVKELRLHIDNKVPYEVFPNLVMNVASDRKVTQQLHYIINRKRSGIYHMGSNDLIHHNEFIAELVAALQLKKPVYKSVYTANFDRYLAVLPRDHKLPKHLQYEHHAVLRDVLLLK